MNNTDPVLEIPAEEIWTYRIDGMPAPFIGKQEKNASVKKVIFIAVILVAVSFSLYFGIRSVGRDTFEYDLLADGSYCLSHFSNTGTIQELNIGCHTDEEKTVTAIGEFALNCDEVVEIIHIGSAVREISATSFYTCRALQQIKVDEDNPYYCDIDGVLYNKDKTELICCPISHTAYVAAQKGYERIPEPEDADYAQFSSEVLTFTVPESVKKIGALAFNYTDIVTVYLPDGLREIGTMAFFKADGLRNIYSATGSDTDGYLSLPDSLLSVGSDAFSYTESLEYIYIPEGVTEIGHHAFWDSGIKTMYVQRSESKFSEVKTGTHWLPQTTDSLINQSAETEYDAVRIPIQ